MKKLIPPEAGPQVRQSPTVYCLGKNIHPKATQNSEIVCLEHWCYQIILLHVSSVKHPSLILLNPGWFGAGFLYWIINIPNIYIYICIYIYIYMYIYIYRCGKSTRGFSCGFHRMCEPPAAAGSFAGLAFHDSFRSPGRRALESWENAGFRFFLMGFLWFSYGFLWFCCGFLWFSMVFYGFLGFF